MTHFPDGSKYVYSPDEDAVNVGWLDAYAGFTRGPVSSEFVSRLREACRNGMNRTRGLYRCPLCPRVAGPGMPPPVRVQSPNGDYVVGGAEIRVPSRSGIVWAAPDMIIHYVVAHHYKPPEEFIEAVASRSRGDS